MAASHGYGRTSRDDSDAEGEGAGGTTDAISGAMILNGPSSRIMLAGLASGAARAHLPRTASVVACALGALVPRQVELLACGSAVV